MTGKSIKIFKSSFKRRLYHTSSSGSKVPLLGHYLAGLIEGDGSRVVPRTTWNQKGVKIIIDTLFYTRKAIGPLVKKYSTFIGSSYLNSNWVTGFSDGEACFSVEIYKVQDLKTGWKISPIFSIGLHSKELALIKKNTIFLQRCR